MLGGIHTSDARLVRTLIESNQAYLFKSWPPAGTRDEAKRALWHSIKRRVAGVGAGVEGARLGTHTLGLQERACTLRTPYTAVLQPPTAPQRPHTVVAHEDARLDEYYWLRDDARKNPDVLAYLADEVLWVCLARNARTTNCIPHRTRTPRRCWQIPKRCKRRCFRR